MDSYSVDNEGSPWSRVATACSRGLCCRDDLMPERAGETARFDVRRATPGGQRVRLSISQLVRRRCPRRCRDSPGGSVTNASAKEGKQYLQVQGGDMTSVPAGSSDPRSQTFLGGRFDAFEGLHSPALWAWTWSRSVRLHECRCHVCGRS